ncbi:MAG: hypothetical protein ACO3A2_01760 [Bdellovibrionia bacterium]
MRLALNLIGLIFIFSLNVPSFASEAPSKFTLTQISIHTRNEISKLIRYHEKRTEFKKILEQVTKDIIREKKSKNEQLNQTEDPEEKSLLLDQIQALSNDFLIVKDCRKSKTPHSDPNCHRKIYDLWNYLTSGFLNPEEKPDAENPSYDVTKQRIHHDIQIKHDTSLKNLKTIFKSGLLMRGQGRDFNLTLDSELKTQILQFCESNPELLFTTTGLKYTRKNLKTLRKALESSENLAEYHRHFHFGKTNMDISVWASVFPNAEKLDQSPIDTKPGSDLSVRILLKPEIFKRWDFIFIDGSMGKGYKQDSLEFIGADKNAWSPAELESFLESRPSQSKSLGPSDYELVFFNPISLKEIRTIQIHGAQPEEITTLIQEIKKEPNIIDIKPLQTKEESPLEPSKTKGRYAITLLAGGDPVKIELELK